MTPEQTRKALGAETSIPVESADEAAALYAARKTVFAAHQDAASMQAQGYYWITAVRPRPVSASCPTGKSCDTIGSGKREAQAWIDASNRLRAATDRGSVSG